MITAELTPDRRIALKAVREGLTLKEAEALRDQINAALVRDWWRNPPPELPPYVTGWALGSGPIRPSR